MNFTFTEFDFTLRDGRSVHLRATQPSDEAELLQTFDCMSPDERYMRFMRPMREPDVDHLRKVLASFPESGFGVVATIPAADGIDIVGSCVAIIDADSSSCEFGITVIANYSRTGLGRVLMTALIDTAKKTRAARNGRPRAGYEPTDAATRGEPGLYGHNGSRGPGRSSLPLASQQRLN
jgi:GNAT superfamily N-acetyltransferase